MPDPIAAVVVDLLHQAETPLREAQRLLPRQPGNGTPEALVAWRISDIRGRLRLAREAWDAPPFGEDA